MEFWFRRRWWDGKERKHENKKDVCGAVIAMKRKIKRV